MEILMGCNLRNTLLVLVKYCLIQCVNNNKEGFHSPYSKHLRYQPFDVQITPTQRNILLCLLTAFKLQFVNRCIGDEFH